MRTTVEIEDRTLERAKKLASASGRTLGELVTEALAAYLPARSSRADSTFQLVVRGRPGGRFPTPDDIARAGDDEELASLGLGSRRAAP